MKFFAVILCAVSVSAGVLQRQEPEATTVSIVSESSFVPNVTVSTSFSSLPIVTVTSSFTDVPVTSTSVFEGCPTVSASYNDTIPTAVSSFTVYGTTTAGFPESTEVCSDEPPQSIPTTVIVFPSFSSTAGSPNATATIVCDSGNSITSCIAYTASPTVVVSTSYSSSLGCVATGTAVSVNGTTVFPYPTGTEVINSTVFPSATGTFVNITTSSTAVPTSINGTNFQGLAKSGARSSFAPSVVLGGMTSVFFLFFAL